MILSLVQAFNQTLNCNSPAFVDVLDIFHSGNFSVLYYDISSNMRFISCDLSTLVLLLAIPRFISFAQSINVTG